jgi:hypothetical protein
MQTIRSGFAMNRPEILWEKIKTEGLNTILKLIDEKDSEDLFLEFKTSANNGNGNKLDRIDLSNYSKAISGFGNSEGGVIVWGVDCSKDKGTGEDCAKSLKEITKVDRFAAFLNDAISKTTIPIHPKVENYSIKTSGDSGIVVSYIPKFDMAPIRSIQNDQYYIRTGSNFSRASHDILSAMFGRHPNPNICPGYNVSDAYVNDNRIFLKIELVLINNGKGIAKDVFLNLYTDDIEQSEAYSISSHVMEEERWISYGNGFNSVSIISNPDFRLPNISRVFAVQFNLQISTKISEDIIIGGSCGADSMPPNIFNFCIWRDKANELREKIGLNFNFKDLDVKSQRNKIFEYLKELQMIEIVAENAAS